MVISHRQALAVQRALSAAAATTRNQPKQSKYDRTQSFRKLSLNHERIRVCSIGGN